MTAPQLPESGPQSAPAAEPDSSEQVVHSLYAAHKKIYPRSVTGLFSKWRWALVWLTQIIFYGLPWLEWGQRQAVLFDLTARRFYIFGLVLYPQDFIYLTGLLVISALSLFLFTAVAGRLWCGYACPQTVYTEIFLWIERKLEGDRSMRMRRDGEPMTVETAARKTGKQLLWVAFALWTGFSFVGYFTPIRELGWQFMEWEINAWEIFWIFFYGFATYGNAGFMREQVCKYMCPYARFQSAMFDHDTLVVTYDEQRGEPRGSRSRKADPGKLGLGACVDCDLCVVVCPTGIDIRKGLQYECIGCGACADVCDTVMDKMGYARGLVKYSTQNAVKQGWSQAQILRHVFRPRVLIYTSVLASIVVAMGVSLAVRIPFKVDVVRDRAVMAREVEDGKIENVYRLQLMNATESAQSFHIGVSGWSGLEIEDKADFTVDAAASRWVVLHVRSPADATHAGSQPIHFEIESLKGLGKLSEKSAFLTPR